MTKKTIDIKFGKLFPFQFHILALLMIVGGIAIVHTHPIISILLALVSILIFTSYSGTTIDSNAKTYKEYRAILFLRIGKVNPYAGIEKLFINTGKISQRIFTPHTFSSTTIKHVEYNAFIKFTDGTKIHLLSKKNKGQLVNQINHISHLLNTSVIDNS